MADAMNLILTQLLKEQDDYKINPTYQMGVALPQIAMQGALSPGAKLNPWEMLLIGALGGLGGGILQGIGQGMGQASFSEKTAGLSDILGAESNAERSAAIQQHPELRQSADLLAIGDALNEREATEAAKSEKLKRIEKILRGEVAPQDYLTPQGVTVQKVPTYDYETDTFGEREVGRSMSPGQKKMAEALAEKEAGNSLYGGPFNPKDQADIEDRMADDLVRAGSPTDQYLKSEAAYNGLLKAYHDNSGIADMQILYKLIQVTEPGLAVKNDDKTIVQTALGLGGKVADLAGWLSSGNHFTKSMKADIIKAASDSRDSRIDLMKEAFSRVEEKAASRKLNSRNILPFETPKESSFLMNQTFGGELWRDDGGKNWIIHKDANGNPVSREEL